MVAEIGWRVRDAARLRARRWLARYPRGVPVAIFLSFAIITLISVTTIEAREKQAEHDTMLEVARSVSTALERRANSNLAYLRGGAALFATADDVNFALFRRYTDELEFEDGDRAIEGLGWADIIAVETVARYERSSRAEGQDGFTIVRDPGAASDILMPVSFMKPETRPGQKWLGYDLYSIPELRSTINATAREQRPLATGKVRIGRQDEADRHGMIIFMPVFVGGTEARALKGFIFSLFDPQQIIDSTMDQSAHAEMGIRMFGREIGDDSLIAQHLPSANFDTRLTQQVRIANRAFLIEVYAARSSSLSLLSMVTLLFGLAMATMLMIVVRLMTQQAIEDDASLAFFEEQHSIRNSLTRELNHRVKNTLASIVSIIALTRRRATSLDEFADGLEGRVRALSATHDLLTQSDWGTTPLRSVVEAELAPYLGGESRIALSGPDILLAPNDALTLGLAMHELATNAAKYGALSQPGGRVEVSWEMQERGLAKVDWQELGGPPVKEPAVNGFGTDLIRKIVAHELRRPVDLRFEPAGVRCTLLVPVRSRSNFEIRDRLARLSD